MTVGLVIICLKTEDPLVREEQYKKVCCKPYDSYVQAVKHVRQLTAKYCSIGQSQVKNSKKLCMSVKN